MCWVSYKLKIKIAKKDIKVWKVVCSTDCGFLNNCRSLITEFLYKKGELELSPMSFEVRRHTVSGDRGFHSYSNKVFWFKTKNFIAVSKKKTLFHPESFITSYSNVEFVKIARFHIPKGAEYAENESGEIISSAIVFDNFIE